MLHRLPGPEVFHFYTGEAAMRGASGRSPVHHRPHAGLTDRCQFSLRGPDPEVMGNETEAEWPDFDPGVLNEEERELWDEYISEENKDGMVVKVWNFGYICTLELGRVPKVVDQYLKVDDIGIKLRQYQDNMRESRHKGRRPGLD